MIIKGGKHNPGQWKKQFQSELYTFDLGESSNRSTPLAGVLSALSSSCTINGSTLSPTRRYYAGDANASGWNAWTYGPNLSILGSAGAFTYNLRTVLPDGSLAIQSSGENASGKKYGSSAMSAAQYTGTKDFAFHLLFQLPTTGGTYRGIFAEWSQAGGYGFYVSVIPTAIRFVFDGPSSTSVTLNPSSLPSGSLQFMSVYGDRNVGMAIYLNGEYKAESTDAKFTGQTDISGADIRHLLLGTSNTDTPSPDAHVVHNAIYLQDNWLNGYSQLADHQRQYAQICGAYAQLAGGQSYQTTITRNSGKYVRRYSPTGKNYFYVGQNWPAVERWIDKSNQVYEGIVLEPASTNLMTYPKTMGNFTATRASHSATSWLDSFGVTNTACCIKEDNTGADTHYTESSAFAVTNASVYTYSFIGNRLNRDWVYCEYYDNTGAAIVGGVYFNLALGLLGDCTSGFIATIEKDGDGYRCRMTFTAVSVSLIVRYYIASANGVTTFDGLDQDSLYVTMHQLEKLHYASSPMIGSGATSSKVVDSLKYSSTNNLNNVAASNTVELKLLSQYRDIDADEKIFEIYDGTNVVNLALSSSLMAGGVKVSSDNVNPCEINGITAITDGKPHVVTARLSTDDCELYVDSNLEGGDVDCDLPLPAGAIDQILIHPSGALLYDIRIQPRIISGKKVFCVTSYDRAGNTDLSIQSDSLKVTLTDENAWTIREILFGGSSMIAATGSNGFVSVDWSGIHGAGHGGEVIASTALTLDSVSKPFTIGYSYFCDAVIFTKQSQVSCFLHNSTITIPATNDYITERHQFTINDAALYAADFRYMYAFMHCNQNDINRYLYVDGLGAQTEGTMVLDDDSTIVIAPDFRALIVYNLLIDKGLVYRFDAVYDNFDSFLWDRAADNKFYFKPTVAGKYAFGDSFEFTVKVTPYIATSSTWKTVGLSYV